jgi:hypothetical protein
MELQTAIEILEYHQEWRLGKREDMIHEPKKLTEALDIVLSEVKKFRLGAVVGQNEQLFCTCSRAKGLDHDEEGMPYCIECQKPVQ